MTDASIDARLDGRFAAWENVVTAMAALRPDASGGAGDATDASAEVPVTVLTGFLGAGKTTLLRDVLTRVTDRRVSALVNDLADLAFDASAIGEVTDDVVSLTNGCSCCALVGDLADALARCASGDGRMAANLSASDASGVPDAMVIELSGAADAVNVCQVIDAAPGVRLDGVVAVVDASAAAEQLAEASLAPILARQLAAAHLVVVSKTDLCDPSEIEALRAELGRIAPGRPVIDRSAADTSVLFGAAERGAALPADARPHETALPSTVIELPLLTRQQLTRQLEDAPPGLLRVKGYADTPDGRVTVESVGRRWSVEPLPDASDATRVRTAPRLALIAVDDASLAAATAHFLGS